MKRRILLVIGGALLLAGMSVPASASALSPAGAYWGCVGSDDLNVAVCLTGPDVPSIPRLPRPPSALPTPDA